MRLAVVLLMIMPLMACWRDREGDMKTLNRLELARDLSCGAHGEKDFRATDRCTLAMRDLDRFLHSH